MEANMKKLLTLLLAIMMVCGLLSGCGTTEKPESTTKIGAVLLTDENDGYTAVHIEGIKKAAKALGISESNILWKYQISEGQDCADAVVDLVDNGCTLILSNSYGHQTYMQEAAVKYPDVTFVAMTGDTGATSGLKNLKNIFNQTFESRYVSGVVAGMKLKEMIDNGTLTKEKMPDAFVGDDIKLGYVGAFPYAEVVSGYSSYYLGVKSVVSNVHMYVEYTNAWSSLTKEQETAQSLLAKGCVVICQHADTTGAPSAVEAASKNGQVCYSVGYNISMLSVAPDVALTSATNDWSVYYTYAFKMWQDGKAMDIATDWSEGYPTDAVAITELGTACAAGTKEKVAEVEAAIKDGSLQVFDVTTFTVGGKQLTEADGVDLTFDGVADIFPIKNGAFMESDVADGFRSAPYFSFRIDGIEEAGAK